MNPEKPAQAANVPTPTERPRRQVPREDIMRRAEQIWRDRNQPSGTDEAIWLEAESQLQAEAESRPVSGTDAQPHVDEAAKPVHSQTKSRDPAEAGAQPRPASDAKSKQRAGKIRNQ